MESNTQSPSPDNIDSKAAFRKPLNDAANRKYRRKSPVNGSSSSDGSPKHEHGSSPVHSGEAPSRDSDTRRRKDDGRDLGRDSGRNHHGRGGDSYRHYNRQSNRSSHSHHRRDDYARHDRYADEEDRNYKSSSRSGRESRVGSMSDYRRRENENYRSRDNLQGDEKYSRDGSGHRSRDKERDHEYWKYKDKDSLSDRAGSGRRHTNLSVEDTKSGEWGRHKGDGDGRDEKRDYWRSSGDYKGRSPVRRDSAGHRSKDKSDLRELDGQKYAKEEKKKYDERETSRHKDRYDGEPGEQFEDGTVFTSENKEESATKKPKFSLGGENVSKFTTVADERQSSSSKQASELGKVTSEQAPAKGSEAGNDIDAAKVAAMKAAELVNRNLVGTGYMSTDQKKKLLWGNKKNTSSEESGHRWDTTLFPDRERQEKFNKLMNLRLPWYLWPIVGCEGGLKRGAEARESRKRPSGEAEGTTAGFGEAIHCRTSSERWTHCWTWSLRVYFECFSSCTMLSSFLVVLSVARILYFVIADFWLLGANYYAFIFLFEILDHVEARYICLCIFGFCMCWKELLVNWPLGLLSTNLIMNIFRETSFIIPREMIYQ